MQQHNDLVKTLKENFTTTMDLPRFTLDNFMEIAKQDVASWRAMLALPLFGRWTLTEVGKRFALRCFINVVINVEQDGKFTRTQLGYSLHSVDDKPCSTMDHKIYGIENEWRRFGLLDRENDLPSIQITNTKGISNLQWFKNGKRHRDNDLPAIVRGKNDKYRKWYRNGKMSRMDPELPSFIMKYRPWIDDDNKSDEYEENRYWLKDGLLHREGDLPAVEDDYGQYWFKEGSLHREGDLPAIIQKDGTKRWCKNGLYHREGDQPAIIYPTEQAVVLSSALISSQLYSTVYFLDNDYNDYLVEENRIIEEKKNERNIDEFADEEVTTVCTKMWYQFGKRQRIE